MLVAECRRRSARSRRPHIRPYPLADNKSRSFCQNDWREGSARKRAFRRTVPWCSGLAYVPVKDEIAGSNPVGTAEESLLRQVREASATL
jgi:hypothetical protein